MSGKNINGDCCICYNATSVVLSCCNQPICDECATKWAKKKHDPSCPMCRKDLYQSLTAIPKDVNVVITCHLNWPITGPIKPCKKVLKVFTSEKTYHIPYQTIMSYRIDGAPLATACGPLREKWISWCSNVYKGVEPLCSQLCIQPELTLNRAVDNFADLESLWEIADAVSQSDYVRNPDGSANYGTWVQIYSINMRWNIDAMSDSL